MAKILATIITSALVTFFIIAVNGEKECNLPQNPVKISTQIQSEGAVIRTYNVPSIVGDFYNGRLFSITVPPGWDVIQDGQHVRLTKRDDITMAIEIIELQGSGLTVEEYIQDAFGQLAVVEKSVIGKNAFARLSPKLGIADSSTLVAKTESGILAIVAGKFNYPEVQAILGSINIK